MSTAMNFSQKSFKPKPPDKGSFPLDHEVFLSALVSALRALSTTVPVLEMVALSFPCRECRKFKEIFMECIRNNNYDSHKCRAESKQYLQCRMDRDLMAKEPLDKLGFADLENENQKETHSNEGKR